MIRELLLEKHSRDQMLRVVEVIKAEPARAEELMNIFFGEEKLLLQRSAWAIRHLSDQRPDLVEPYLEQMIKNLRRSNLHDAVKRNTVAMLEVFTIPEHMYGEVVSICFDYLADFDTKVAIKCFSMSVIWKICQYEPDLSNELKLLIEEQMDYQSNGFKSRGRKILKAMRENK
ncbi:MAG: hypothetical protein AAFP82_18060 [Bacteroidota bacterium]